MEVLIGGSPFLGTRRRVSRTKYQGMIDVEFSNKLRGDNNSLKNTVSDWSKAPAHFNSVVGQLNRYVVNVIDKAIVAGAAENSAQGQFFTGQATPWTPAASSVRSSAGAGQSDNTWRRNESTYPTDSGLVYKTVFTKNDIVMARCTPGKNAAKEFTQKYGGRIIGKVQSAMKAMIQNKYNGIIDDTIFSHARLSASNVSSSIQRKSIVIGDPALSELMRKF